MTPFSRHFNRILSILLALILIAPLCTIGPTRVLAQSNDLKIVRDHSWSNGVITVDVVGELSHATITVKNERPYWVNLSIDVKDMAPPIPQGLINEFLVNTLWALPPEWTISFVASFDRAGAEVTFSAGLAQSYASTPELYLNTLVMNFTTVIFDLIFALAPSTPTDIAKTLDMMSDLPEFAAVMGALGDVASFDTSPKDKLQALLQAGSSIFELVNNDDNRARLATNLADMEWVKNQGYTGGDILVQLDKLSALRSLAKAYKLWSGMLWDEIYNVSGGYVTIKVIAREHEFTINPVLSVSPLSGPAGTPFEVTGEGFTPNDLANLELKKPNRTQSTIMQLNVSRTGEVQGIIDSSGFGLGSYSLWAVDVFTGDKSDPVTFTITSPFGLPDLTVAEVNMAAFSVQLGETISVGFTVKNQGDSTSGPFFTWVCLSTATHGTDTVLGKFTTNSLEAGASEIATVNVAIPPSVNANGYHLTVFADAPGLGVVTEENEDNNIGSSSPDRLVINPLPPGQNITVSSPDGGEHWPVGRVRGISWDSSAVSGDVRIELSRNGGSSWETIIANTPNDGNEWWTVTGPSTTEARVRIVSVDDSSISDSSDGNFTILQMDVTVTSPNGGENWTAGSTYTITWSVSGNTANLEYFWVKYSLNGGSSWTNINMAAAGARSLTWTIPSDMSSSQCQVMVRALDTEGWILDDDTSNANFTVAVGIFSPPSHISPSNGASGVSPTPTFQWGSVSGADRYGLYISEPPYGPANLVYENESLTGTSLTLPSGVLSEGVTYYWNMRAHNSAGWGSFSSSWSFTTLTTAKFIIGDRVRTTANLNVRTGPGTSYPEITDPDYPGYAPVGATGTVISGPVSADGYVWWEVQYDDGYTGWSVENWLETE